jgi:flagellar biosynthesis/type III secretory pathway chaperone
MNVTVRRIVQQLRRMIEQHDELLDLAERKSDVIVRNQVDELTKIMHEESKRVREIAELEQGYVAAAADLFRDKGIEPSASVTMSDVIKLLTDPAEKRALSETRDALMNRIERLKERNARNQKLIEMSLAYINFTLDLVTGGDQEVVYQKPTKAPYAPNGRSSFEAKA